MSPSSLLASTGFGSPDIHWTIRIAPARWAFIVCCVYYPVVDPFKLQTILCIFAADSGWSYAELNNSRHMNWMHACMLVYMFVCNLGPRHEESLVFRVFYRPTNYVSIWRDKQCPIRFAPYCRCWRCMVNAMVSVLARTWPYVHLVPTLLNQRIISKRFSPSMGLCHLAYSHTSIRRMPSVSHNTENSFHSSHTNLR